MKKMMRLVILALIAVMAFTGCGKSDAATPQGVYEHNGSTLDFSGSEVVVTEGGVSTSCDYTSDKDGNLVIDPKGEKIPASYDADADVVTVDYVKYRKESGSARDEEGSPAEGAELESMPEGAEVDSQKLRVGTYDEASDTIIIMEMELTKAAGE